MKLRLALRLGDELARRGRIGIENVLVEAFQRGRTATFVPLALWAMTAAVAFLARLEANSGGSIEIVSAGVDVDVQRAWKGRFLR